MGELDKYIWLYYGQAQTRTFVATTAKTNLRTMPLALANSNLAFSFRLKV